MVVALNVGIINLVKIASAIGRSSVRSGRDGLAFIGSPLSGSVGLISSDSLRINSFVCWRVRPLHSKYASGVTVTRVIRIPLARALLLRTVPVGV